MGLQPYVYRAKVERVVDGDTIDLFVSKGFESYLRGRFRFYGIDAPETYGVKKDSEEWRKGKAATKFVEEWIEKNGEKNEDESFTILVRSHDGGKIPAGKYGRWIVEVFGVQGEGKSLNETLVEQGLAEHKTYK